MARKARIEYPGAFYHVMARGNRKEAIFRDDKDRLSFLQKLLVGKVRKRARVLYDEFVREWLVQGRKEEFYRLIDQRFLGEEGFVEDVKGRIGERYRRSENILRDKTLKEISKAVEQVTGVYLDGLRSVRRSEVIVRAHAIFVRLALIYSGHKRREMAYENL